MAKFVKFGTLKIGDKFTYQNKEFRKTLPVDMGSCLYNAITKEVYGSVFIVYLPDDRRVMIKEAA